MNLRLVPLWAVILLRWCVNLHLHCQTTNLQCAELLTTLFGYSGVRQAINWADYADRCVYTNVISKFLPKPDLNPKLLGPIRFGLALHSIHPAKITLNLLQSLRLSSLQRSDWHWSVTLVNCCWFIMPILNTGLVKYAYDYRVNKVDWQYNLCNASVIWLASKQ